MKRHCPFCDIIVGNSPHIYFCKNKITEDKIQIKFLYIKRNFPNICDKETLSKLYERKSLPDIRSEFVIDFKSILFLLDYFKIKKRNNSESSILISKEKYKKTCNKKYGVDNVSKHHSIKEKKKSTFINNYGVDNIFKSEDFKKWILDNNFAWNNLSDEENRNRIKKQTESIKKYWMNLNDEQKSKIHNTGGTSKLESKVSESLNYLSISYRTQFPLGGKLFDFILTDTKILIEVNGDYWHCNPSKYKGSQFINYPFGKIKAIDIWKKDYKKKQIAEKNGYQVLYIWEDEIKKSNDISNLIIEKLNLAI